MNRSAPMRRTPMKQRTKPFFSGANPGRNAGGAEVADTVIGRKNAPLAKSPPSRRAVRDTGFPRAVRALVWARSAGYCEACGTWLGDHGGQLQHRLARRAGGSRDPVISSAANGARLCGTPQSGCHGRCEARSEHMRAAGWWLASWQDPRTEPVLLHGRDGGTIAWLTDGGEYSFMPPAEVA